MRFHSANHQPNPLAAYFSQAERSGFYASKTCRKRFRTIFAANRPICLIPHNEKVRHSWSYNFRHAVGNPGFALNENPSKRLGHCHLSARRPKRFCIYENFAGRSVAISVFVIWQVHIRMQGRLYLCCPRDPILTITQASGHNTAFCRNIDRPFLPCVLCSHLKNSFINNLFWLLFGEQKRY